MKSHNKILLFVFICVIFSFVGTGGQVKIRMTEDEMQDSIKYYRNQTILNWQLLRESISKEDSIKFKNKQ